MREQPVFSVDRTFSLVACVLVLSLLPLVDDSDTAPCAVQTVGGLTVCQICLLIQTLSLSTLVTCNTYLFSSITQNPVIQTRSFFFHLLSLTAEGSVLRRGTFICIQASRTQMLWIVCSCDPLLYVCTFPVACGWGYYGNRIRREKKKKRRLVYASAQAAVDVCGHYAFGCLSICPSHFCLRNNSWEFLQIWHKCLLGLEDELVCGGQRSRSLWPQTMRFWP